MPPNFHFSPLNSILYENWHLQLKFETLTTEVAEIKIGAWGIWFDLRKIYDREAIKTNFNEYEASKSDTTELKEILVISRWQNTFFWQSFWYHLLSLYALCEIKGAFSRVVTWTLVMIYQCDLKFRIPFKINFYVYTNSLVNANLFYANFTNTTFQKIPIPHLTRTLKQKFLH